MLEINNASLYVSGVGGNRTLLHDVSLCVAPGETLALVGENGCGKSSLASLMCASRLCSDGTVKVDGLDPAAGSSDRLEVRRLVGLVRQNPLDQIVSSTVSDEVAFGPRNLGLSEDEIASRVSESLAFVGLDGFETRDTAALSGGEQQRLAIAGVLAMRPCYIVFDEATSMLDAALRASMRELYGRLAHEMGLGIVLITHDPVEILACDRVMAMHAGSSVWNGSPWDLLCISDSVPGNPLERGALNEAFRAILRLGFDPRGHEPENRVEAAFSWLLEAYTDSKATSHDVAAVRETLMAPYAVESDGRMCEVSANDGADSKACRGLAERSAAASTAAPGIEVTDLAFAYTPDAPVIRGLSMSSEPGRILLLVGASGCGKSTLCSLMAGLAEPDAGRVQVAGAPAAPGRCGLSFQNPESQLFLNTVYDEIAFAPMNCGCSAQELQGRVERAAELADVSPDLFERYPYELSGGQARRVAVASILSLDAAAYIFDEPTAGLDARGRERTWAMARRLADAGRCVVVVSHDVDEWLPVVDEVALMAEGTVTWIGSAAKLAAEPALLEGVGVAVPVALSYATKFARVLEQDGGYGEEGHETR